LSNKLNDCNASISSLRIAKDDLNAKIVKLNECHASSSSIEHVIICTRCKNVDVYAFNSNVALISSLNDDITKLTESRLEGE
jgi:hypothetical protein